MSDAEWGNKTTILLMLRHSWKHMDRRLEILVLYLLGTGCNAMYSY